MYRKQNHTLGSKLILSWLIATVIMLAGCGGAENSNNNNSQNQADKSPNIQMEIPHSLTGDTQQNATVAGFASAHADGTGKPCAYKGNGNEDPFRNGYNITKLLVSAIATWSCIGDLLVDVSNFVEHDGEIHATGNDTESPKYKPEDPTHYSVIDDSDSQTTVRLYYNHPLNNPPTEGDVPQFYISWNESADDVLEGKIVVDARTINQPNRKADDPIMLRMDFLYTNTEKSADMFLRFDEGNQWAEGFRIHLVRDMNANPLQKVYVARGMIKMKAQFIPVADIPEVPDVHFYTVSNRAGDGAAVADFQNVSLPLQISGGIIDNHLGNYLFTKNDTYYFDDNGHSDWIFKTVTSSEYRGSRNTPETGGTWIPLDPSLDMIIDALHLDNEPGNEYFTGNKCAVIGNDCNQLLNALFSHTDDFAGQELNDQIAEPVDWRSEAIMNAETSYLPSVYPNGVDWTGAFDLTFIPTM